MLQKKQIFTVKGIQCMNCVNEIRNDLQKNKIINKVEINTNLNKIKITSKEEISINKLQSYLNEKYKILTKEKKINSDEKISKFKELQPLFLILSYIFFSSIFLNYNKPNTTSFMLDFMGQFFIVFSFFKILDLRGFTESFKKYDPIAKRFNIYSWIYPFIEIIIGFLLLSRICIYVSLIAMVLILSLTSIGVIHSLNKKDKIQCACLGSVLNLPMTEVTLIENAIMIMMGLLIITSI